MEQNINIADLLKDCPKGTKLYSPIFGECEFVKLDKSEYGHLSIFISVEGHNLHYSFDKYGYYLSEFNGECLLFPSKEVRDWGCFNVQMTVKIGSLEGAHNLLENITRAMLEREMEAWSYAEVGDVMYTDSLDNFWKCAKAGTPECEYILANNAMKKVLGKEQPKFKVGDVVKVDGSYFMLGKYQDIHGKAIAVNIENANIKSLYPCLATPEEIAKWNEEVLEPNHLHYYTNKRRIGEWINPTDFVVVRGDKTEWCLGMFSHCKKLKEGNLVFNANGIYYPCCLPYNEKTAKLIGTTDDWKE